MSGDLSVRVRNLLGVEAADFPASRITLIGGKNGAGKSSILEAIACVVRGEHETRGVKTKRDAVTLVRNGAPAGSATIEWPDGAARVLWPDAEAKATGSPRFLGTPLGIGAVRWMALQEKARLQELSERVGLAPTKADLTAFVREYEAKASEQGEAIEAVQDATIDAVWALVQEQGWDGAFAKASEQVKRLRDRWEDRSDSRFGSAKSATWRPPVLDEAETYTIEGAEAAVRDARKRVEDLVAAGAIGAEEVERTRQAAADLGPAKAREAAGRAKVAELDGAIERQRAELAKMPDVFDVVHSYPCPHCEKPLWLNRPSPDAPFRIEKPPEQLPAAEIKKRRIAKQGVAQSIEHLQRELSGVTRDVQEAVAAVRAAEQATARLTEMEGRPRVTDADMAKARADEACAKEVLEGVRAWLDCQAIYAEWRRSQPVLAALDPSGVRAKKAIEAIAAFNLRLAAISGIAGFGEVAMNSDAEPTMGGRAYHLLSESERWRVDLAITLSLAEREKASLVLVDRLDVLHPQARPGVFQLLAHIGIPAVVCCTAKDAAALPPLHKVMVPGTDQPFGRTYWIEEGRLAPVATEE